MTVPPVSLRLPENAYRELAILAHNLEKISEFAEDIRSTENVQELKNKIAAETGLPKDDVSILVQGLVNIHSTLVSTELEPQVFVDALTLALERTASTAWKTENWSAWTKASPAITTLLSHIGPDSHLSIIGKSRHIESAHENLYMNSRIFTSLRPVFNRAGDAVQRMVIFNELIINYSSGGNQHNTLELVLDAEDLVELKKQCERAQLKASTTKAALRECSWSTYILKDPDEE